MCHYQATVDAASGFRAQVLSFLGCSTPGYTKPLKQRRENYIQKLAGNFFEKKICSKEN
jgi:hypothetical protein